MTKSHNNRWFDILLGWFYPLLMIDYFLIMLGINLNSIIMLPVIFMIVLLAAVYASKSISRNDRGSILITVFLLYNILSIAIITITGVPIECYANRLKDLLFPMLFFYFGVERSKTDDNFYKSFFYSALACFAVGLVLYVWAPPFYTSYLVSIREETYYMGNNYLTEDDIMEYTRFGSFFSSSYAVSYFSIPALCIAFTFIFRKAYKNNVYLYLAAFLCFVSAILCQQRVAMVYSAFVVLFFAFYGLRHGQRTMLPVLGLVTLLSVVLVLQFVDSSRLSVIDDLLTERFHRLDFNDAMSARTGQYERTFHAWNNYLLGDGMGSHSGVALMYKRAVVTDGEYYRILYENGILGLLLFVAFLFTVFTNALKYMKYYWLELLSVGFFLAAGIGSNSLSMLFYYTPVFWFCMGRLCNKGYLERLRAEARA